MCKFQYSKTPITSSPSGFLKFSNVGREALTHDFKAMEEQPRYCSQSRAATVLLFCHGEALSCAPARPKTLLANTGPAHATTAERRREERSQASLVCLSARMLRGCVWGPKMM